MIDSLKRQLEAVKNTASDIPEQDARELVAALEHTAAELRASFRFPKDQDAPEPGYDQPDRDSDHGAFTERVVPLRRTSNHR